MCASKRMKILTIDDDADIRNAISERLELEGFEALWAKNGQVALDYLSAITDEHLPDLILLDYMMPIMNGLEFCQAKSKIKRVSHIPVIIMTAGGNIINLMDKIDEVADGYISKPMDDESMMNLVKHFSKNNITKVHSSFNI
jgi:two-component system, OmpR family, alkaline phosphatase synthesis response regulator PhoP